MRRLAYGAWPSPIDAGVVAAGSAGYAELKSAGNALYWLESRPEQSGRSTLMRYAEGSAEELTPPPFNPRSRVHEYGGGCYCVADGSPERVFFVDHADQNIYEAGGVEARPVTDGDASERFGDICWSDGAILAVRERHGEGEPVNDLVRVDPERGEVRVLHEGHDFYAAPRAERGRLAFLAWDHPNMPWDGTQLIVCDSEGSTSGDGSPSGAVQVAGGAAESIVQPTWNAGRLLFASDAGGYWNLHAYDDSGVYCVIEEAAEYAGPGWQLGATYYVPVGAGHVVARRVEDGVQSLVLVDIERGLSSPLHDACSSYAGLARTPRGVAFIGGFPGAARQVLALELATRRQRTIARPAAVPVPAEAISTPSAITFSTPEGESHAFFYPPVNGDLAGLPGELPPLLVTTHGGPTSATDADLSWRTQYYTSRGWAVADVNYAGSTGYGRPFRERLAGAWGRADVADCVACVRHLVAEGRVDPLRVAIRGGSAGGYTTLAALAFTDAFRVGASHYGIGDLARLAADTHKFESRYLDALVGGDSAMRERSPIHHVERLNCPVIFFQGADDEVVPPNQSRAMHDALVAKGIRSDYHLFEGEAHGFRKAENVRRAIDLECAFFLEVFTGEAAAGQAS